MIPSIVRAEKVTVILNGKTYNVPSSHSDYAKVIDMIHNDDVAGLEKLLDPSKAIQAQTLRYPNLVLEGNAVKYKEEFLPEAMNVRLLHLLRTGVDVMPILTFVDNLNQNPSFRACQELYGFLDACDLPITSDGYFLAYKIVNKDFKDLHTKTFDNSVGQTVKIPRNKVDEDSSRTCSHGLHVCSQEYLAHFGNHRNGDDRVVMVKVHPKDVVAVPQDYNNSKMRVCEYKVLQEVDGLIQSWYVPTFENKHQEEEDDVLEEIREEAPDWASFAAEDCDGDVYYFEFEPSLGDGIWEPGQGRCKYASQFNHSLYGEMIRL